MQLLTGFFELEHEFKTALLMCKYQVATNIQVVNVWLIFGWNLRIKCGASLMNRFIFCHRSNIQEQNAPQHFEWESPESRPDFKGVLCCFPGLFDVDEDLCILLKCNYLWIGFIFEAYHHSVLAQLWSTSQEGRSYCELKFNVVHVLLILPCNCTSIYMTSQGWKYRSNKFISPIVVQRTTRYLFKQAKLTTPNAYLHSVRLTMDL